jgi:hypothetical protein
MKESQIRGGKEIKKTVLSRAKAVEMFGENGFYPVMSGGVLVFRQGEGNRMPERHLPVANIDQPYAGNA